MSDWLRRLHTLVGEPPLDPCDNSDEMRRNSISSHNVTNVTGISGPFSPSTRCRGRPLRWVPELPPGGVLAVAQVPSGP